MNTYTASQQASADEHESRLRNLLRRQRTAFIAESEVTAEARIDRLTRCINLLVDNSATIVEAVVADYGCRSKRQSLLSEIMSTLGPLKNARKNVKQWMRPERRRSSFPFNLIRAHSEIWYQPLGVVGVIGPWNFPFHLTLAPLAGILAAGNRCMIKPSEYTPNSASLLANLIRDSFDESEIAVVTGGPEIGAEFSGLPFDHLLFTGGTNIGRHVMRSAADNLVPVTLELGGKNPVIVSRTADMTHVANSCIGNKTFNSGQICMSPDYVFVEKDQLDSFISEIRTAAATQFPTMLDNEDYGSVLGDRNYQRLNHYLEDARQKGARLIEMKPNGEDFSNQPHYKIPFTLILDVNEDMLVMKEEIFGPLLAVMTYRNTRECIDYVNQHPRPLSLYYFGRDKQEEELVLQRTISGGVTVNGMISHYAQDDLPFGGVGDSGMGAYHGIHGFRQFSHAKSIFHQRSFDIMRFLGVGLYTPYTRNFDRTLRSQIKR